MGEAKRKAAAPYEPEVIELQLPIRADINMNSRHGHWSKRHRQNMIQKTAVGWLLSRKKVPKAPLTVHLTRFAPATSKVMDDDNIVGTLKAVRDAIATWSGFDDGDKANIRFVYEPGVKGPWSVKAVIKGS